MDLNWFGKTMEKPPGQGAWEWQTYLEFIEAYFKNRGIEKPIVVEIGTRRNRQKVFYEQLLSATHIGIDASPHFSKPDILGDSRSPETLKTLQSRLKGVPINLLFIDGDHSYEAVKSDYEMYGPLVSNIIALHDVYSPEHGVRKFWKQLTEDCTAPSSKRSMRIGWAIGLVVVEGERDVYETHLHKGRYYF